MGPHATCLARQGGRLLKLLSATWTVLSFPCPHPNTFLSALSAALYTGLGPHTPLIRPWIQRASNVIRQLVSNSHETVIMWACNEDLRQDVSDIWHFTARSISYTSGFRSDGCGNSSSHLHTEIPLYFNAEYIYTTRAWSCTRLIITSILNNSDQFPRNMRQNCCVITELPAVTVCQEESEFIWQRRALVNQEHVEVTQCISVRCFEVQMRRHLR
jgi:hypothetical protein